MDCLRHQGELVVGTCDVFAQPPVVGIKEIDPYNGGGLKHEADFDLGVAFLDALQRAARYAGAFCQFRRAQPAFLAGKPDKLAKQRDRVAQPDWS